MCENYRDMYVTRIHNTYINVLYKSKYLTAVDVTATTKMTKNATVQIQKIVFSLRAQTGKLLPNQ